MSRRSVLPVIRPPHLLVAGLAAFGLHAAAATVMFWPEHRTGAIGAGAGGLEIGLAGAIGAPSNSVDSAEEDAPPVAESDALPPPAETVADDATIPEAAMQETAVQEAAAQEAPVQDVPVQDAPVEAALAADAAPPLAAAAEPVRTALLAPETPAREATVEEAPVEEALVEEAPVEEASVEEATVPALTAPRPVARPDRPEPPARPQRQTPPRRTTTPPARQAARPAPAAARPPAAQPPAAQPPAAPSAVDAQSGESAAAAAPGGGGGAAAPGGGDPGAEADYQARVRARLARAKTYPRRAQARRQEGVGRLRFTVDRSGRALSHVIVRSSGHALLDKAMVDMIARAQPFPPFPASLAKSQITMEFDVRFRMP